MGDIFGRNALNYRHLRETHARDPDAVDLYLQDSAEFENRPVHDFNVQVQNRTLQNATTAETVGWMTDNLQAMKSVVDEVLYVRTRYPEYVPIKMDVDEGAESYQYRVMDGVGEATYLEEEGTTAQSATASVQTVPYQLFYGGIVADWHVRQVQKAMFGGVPLDRFTLEKATRSCINRIEGTLFNGSDTIGLDSGGVKGLINQTADANASIDSGNRVKIVDTGTNNYFSGSETGDQMAAKLNSWVSGFIEDTKTIIGDMLQDGMTLYLPVKQHGIVTTKRLPDINMTVWEYFSINNAWRNFTDQEVQLKHMVELTGASATAGQDRGILALNNEEVMEATISISPRVMHVEEHLYQILAPFEFAHSPLNVKRQAGMRYIDRV